MTSLNRLVSSTRWMTAIVLSVVVSCALAQDARHPVPAGWIPNPYVAAVAGDLLAVSLNRDDVPETSRIMQYRGGGNYVFTDLAGRVRSLKFSKGVPLKQDGDLLIALHRTSTASKVSLLNASGQVVWTKDDPRSFSFVTGSELVYAWDSNEATSFGTSVTIFDANGTSHSTLDSESTIASALVSMVGSEPYYVVLRRETVTSYKATVSGAPWKIDHPNLETDPPLSNLQTLSNDHFMMRHHYGMFKVASYATGQVQYTYNPYELGEADVERDKWYFARYQPYSGSTPEEIFLFDGTSDAMTVDITTGVVTHVTVDTTTPPGFSIVPGVYDHHLVLVSPSSVRVRALP